MKKTLIVIAIAFVLSFVLTACGAGSSDASGFPTGRFVSATNSNYVYTFNADKTWEYVEWGTVEASGTYEVKGNRWTENGDVLCPFPATYEWSFDGANLTFTLVGEDECNGRREATDGQTYVLQP